MLIVMSLDYRARPSTNLSLFFSLRDYIFRHTYSFEVKPFLMTVHVHLHLLMCTNYMCSSYVSVSILELSTQWRINQRTLCFERLETSHTITMTGCTFSHHLSQTWVSLSFPSSAPLSFPTTLFFSLISASPNLSVKNSL